VCDGCGVKKKCEENRDLRSVRKHGSDEDDMRFDDIEDEACWRGILKQTTNYKYFQGGRVEQGRGLVSPTGWCL
jgi:hypothetical protein